MLMPPGSRLVFDQVVSSAAGGGFGNYVFSDPRHNDWLGAANDLRCFAVIDRATANGSFVCFFQETADEEQAWYGTEGGGFAATITSPGTVLTSGSDTEALRGGPSTGYRRLMVGLGGAGATYSARVRIWAAGRNGYRKYHRLLLDERVEGTQPVYGPQENCSWLADADEICIAVLTDDVTGTTPTLALIAADSPNRVVWETNTLSAYPINSGKFQVIRAIGTASQIGGAVRFGVQLGGTTPGARVRLWATGRDICGGPVT